MNFYAIQKYSFLLIVKLNLTLNQYFPMKYLHCYCSLSPTVFHIYLNDREECSSHKGPVPYEIHVHTRYPYILTFIGTLPIIVIVFVSIKYFYLHLYSKTKRTQTSNWSHFFIETIRKLMCVCFFSNNAANS